MTALPQLYQFRNSFQSKIGYNNSYIVNIKGMKLWLLKLQNNNKEAKALKFVATRPPED